MTRGFTPLTPSHFENILPSLISLACVSSETRNLQRVFRGGGAGGGGSPLYRCWYVLRQRVWFFLAVLVRNRVSISTILVWNRVSFVRSSLELVMFFRRISYFLIIGRWDHFPFNVYANYRVSAVTACHALRSSAGLQGFSSEIGYQIFDQVWNRVGKIADFGLK